MDSDPDDQRTTPSRPSSHVPDASSDLNARSGPTKTRLPSTSRTNIRSACAACRRRRSRCSGGVPCDRCRALETDCTYNESQDGRTRALRDRGREELEMHKRVVDSIFRAVREGREQDLLSLIRSNASLDVIATAFEDSNVNASLSVYPSPAGHQGADNPVDGMPIRLRDMQQVGFLHQTSPILQSQPYIMGQSTSNMAPLSPDPAGMLYQPIRELDQSVADFEHMLQPLHQHDTSHLQRLSIICAGFCDIARQMIANGVPVVSVLGSSHVPCDVLLNSRPITSTMSVWVYALVNSVHGADELFRLAWFSYITRFLRWTVHPSKEHFDQMPQAMVPTPLQSQVPHAPMIDLIPIPLMRDSIIENFRDFVTALDHAGATVRWNGSMNETVEHDPITGNTIISPRFEHHISDLDNFWFGRNLLNTFPELEGHVRIAAVDKIVFDSQVNLPAQSLFEPGPL